MKEFKSLEEDDKNIRKIVLKINRKKINFFQDKLVVV